MMSGTSADGIDAALVEISGAPPTISAKLAGHHHISFPAHVRKKILRLANDAVTTTAEISELNFVLGEWFAEAAIQSCRRLEDSASADFADRLARPDDLSSGSAGDRSRRAAHRLHFADRRTERDCRANRSSNHRQFPPAGYRRGRPGRAARSVCGLFALSRSASQSRRAQHRRHRQRHRDPGERAPGRRFRFRYRPRQYDRGRASRKNHEGPRHL